MLFGRSKLHLILCSIYCHISSDSFILPYSILLGLLSSLRLCDLVGVEGSEGIRVNVLALSRDIEEEIVVVVEEVFWSLSPLVKLRTTLMTLMWLVSSW